MIYFPFVGVIVPGLRGVRLFTGGVPGLSAGPSARAEGKLCDANCAAGGLCTDLFSMKTKLFILTIFFLVYFKLFKKEKKKRKKKKPERRCYFITFVVATIYFVSLRFSSPFLIRFGPPVSAKERI